MADKQVTIDKFRDVLSDTRFVVPAFDAQLIDKESTKGTVEFDGTSLILDATGGKAVDRSINVSDPLYDTVTKISRAIAKTQGWDSRLDPAAVSDHPSSDLQITTPLDAKSTRVPFKTRRFSDTELEHILSIAIHRHNQTMSIETIPDPELSLVINLAHAEALYRMATDTSKRSGLDTDAKTLLDIARALEKKYLDDFSRLNFDVSPTQVTDDTLDVTEEDLGGDITMGKAYRVSPRYGNLPSAFNVVPGVAKLFAGRYVDRGDGIRFIELTWKRVRLHDFGYIIIYRHTSPDFNLMLQPYSGGVSIDPPGAVDIYRTFDQRIIMARDETLEPNKIYYYRLFILDSSFEFSRTEALQILTPAF